MNLYPVFFFYKLHFLSINLVCDKISNQTKYYLDKYCGAVFKSRYDGKIIVVN